MGKRLEELNLDPAVRFFTGEIKTAQGRLALFVRDLPRLFQRLIVGLKPRGSEILDYLDMSEEQVRDYKDAEREYKRHISAVARELARFRGRESVLRGLVLEDLGEILFKSRPRRGGAPKKELADRIDVQILDQVSHAAIKLAPGVELCQELRRRGGYKSDAEEISQVLQARGYTGAEARAIIGARKPVTAAARLIADQRHTDLPTIQAALSRARKLLASR